jgi:hypothetical protein
MNAINMGDFIAPKSNQTNADDLTAGPRTIRITRVSANPSEPTQPVAMNYEGDDGKPYLPCKSMRRVFVSVWGADASKYVGRSVTLYRDAKVTFGGMAVGGIRISHMSDIAEPVTLAITMSKAKRAPMTIQPLRTAKRQPEPVEAPHDAETGEVAAEPDPRLQSLYAIKGQIGLAMDAAELKAVTVDNEITISALPDAMQRELRVAYRERAAELDA